MLTNPDDDEDVVQDAFVRLYRALPRYEERERFESWLFHILGNCCRTANKGFLRRDVRVIGLRAAERVAATEPAAAEEEWGDAVRRALSEIPAHNREVFLLHYVEEFSYEDIERMTGVRKSALKMRVKRASDLLRSKLAGMAHD